MTEISICDLQTLAKHEHFIRLLTEHPHDDDMKILSKAA